MWYVMQVFTGKEEEVQKFCEITIDPELLQSCFCPKYEMVFKDKGIRRVVTRVLFPGYLFLVTEDIRALSEALRQVPRLTKVLKTDTEFIPISEEEQKFIEEHGNAEHIFRMSKGYTKGDEVIITEGAFAGYQGIITYIDRHNRFAKTEIDMFGRKTEVKFGLEIVKKIE